MSRDIMSRKEMSALLARCIGALENPEDLDPGDISDVIEDCQRRIDRMRPFAVDPHDKYRVWLHVEPPLKEDGTSSGEDIDLVFGATAAFSLEKDAVTFATMLHRAGLAIYGALPAAVKEQASMEFCNVCKKWKPWDTLAWHAHNELGHVCDDCWDERLRSTE